MIKFKPYSFTKASGSRPHFDWRPVLSYGTQIVGAVGARRYGKTYGCKKIITDDFLYNGGKFIWLRDNDESIAELAAANGYKFFSDYSKEYKHLEGSVKGNEIFINGKKAGEFGNFMTFYRSKGTSFDDSFKNLVLDEFIPERGQASRQFRARSMINMLYTIASTRQDVRIWLTANALNRSDSILKAIGIEPREFGIYIKTAPKGSPQQRIAIHYCDNHPDFEKAQKTSVVGGLIAGSEFEDNLFNNQFADDKNLFYDVLPARSKLVCILHDIEGACRCYIGDKGILYVSEDINPDTRNDIRFVNDYNLLSTTTRMIPKTMLDACRRVLRESDVRFQNGFVKNIFLSVVKNR